jgi:hypothetical protein
MPRVGGDSEEAACAGPAEGAAEQLTCFATRLETCLCCHFILCNSSLLLGWPPSLHLPTPTPPHHTDVPRFKEELLRRANLLLA